MNPVTVMVILGLGVLLFGRNLPEVARKVGVSLMEFRRGMNELKGSLDFGLTESLHSGARIRSEERVEPSAENQESIGMKFEPPPES